MAAQGFTLIELVVTMVLIGILAITVLPRFADLLSFDTRGYADQAGASLRYAQKIAVAQRRRIQVAVTTSSVTLTHCAVAVGSDACSAATTTCNGVVTNPAGGNAYVIAAPTGVSISPAATFRFDCLGRPMQNDTTALATTTFTVAGDSNIGVTVETETGYVH